MCGIIGVIGQREAAPILIEGLKRLEYRGYDSSGIAILTDPAKPIAVVKSKGKLKLLERKLEQEGTPHGSIGIGHTRWATHGVPNDVNAHPHSTGDIAVVHNGIIENHRELRAELTKLGMTFHTETDTEVIVMLLQHYVSQGMAPRDAVAKTLARLDGAFALGMVFNAAPDRLFAARRGSPLAIGYGDGEMFVGSDAMTLAPMTSQVCYLEEGDWAEITANGATIHDPDGNPVERHCVSSQLDVSAISRGNYRHYMLKEIHEQPGVIGDSLRAMTHPETGKVDLPLDGLDLAGLEHITIVACGTSYYAGLVARYWLEGIARVTVEIDVASEFRYRAPNLPKGGLVLCISQSGETADTLAGLRYAKERGNRTLALVNVRESMMAREADFVLATHAGPEIGVASTKAFTTQLATLACFTLAVARARGTIDPAREAQLSRALMETPSRMIEALGASSALADIAHKLFHARDVLYIGRGTSYALAMEGALKLKEISYIHAEGYAAGELKHGPIALIDEFVPVIAIAPRDGMFEKTASNVQEVTARGGKVLLMSDEKGVRQLSDLATWTVKMPDVDPLIAPLLYAIPIQLLAYHVAVLKGTDIDQPRNLAKSVTVE